MDRFETSTLINWNKNTLIWLRFIDYIFMLRTHGLDNIHDKIKFTHESSAESINFLDITVKIDKDRSLHTTLYEKPTDTHLYLHYTSAHHKPCHTKGPFGQFLRICRIHTKNEDCIHHGIKMIEHYLKRGYHFKTLKSI